MPNFISEDDIERDIIKVFRNETLSYEYLNCYTATAEDLNDKSGRGDKKQVVLLDRLQTALRRINQDLPESAINKAIEQLTQSRVQLSVFDANKAVYALLRGGVTVVIRLQRDYAIVQCQRDTH
jgi:type I restriction enzyme R subunit